MYVAGTILVMKEPKSTEDTLFPYDRVRVLGPSLIYHSNRGHEYEGIDSSGVVIEPLTDAAMNLDEPLGRLKRLYNIEWEPEGIEPDIEVRRIQGNTRQAGLTPEEFILELEEKQGVEMRKPDPRVKPRGDLADLDPQDDGRYRSPLEEVVPAPINRAGKPTPPVEKKQSKRPRGA